MNEILKDLESAFDMISKIPVSGNSVEIMAAAKNTLRRVYAEVREIGEVKTQTEKQTDKSEG